MGSLDGRRILVTGASSGIGRSTATALAAAGARLGLLARRRARLEAVAAEVGGAAVAPADVVDPAGVTAAIDAVADELGGLDGIVNSAGLSRPGAILDADPADWRDTFEVNVLGLLHVTQAAVPHLRGQRPADVVNVSSMSGRRRASVRMTVYSASKFAVHVLSDGLRDELREHGIRVTVISPGFVRTPIFDRPDADDVADEYRRRMEATGLDPEVVAGQIVLALAQPPEVEVIEVASMSTVQ